jgi:hypothetical protein
MKVPKKKMAGTSPAMTKCENERGNLSYSIFLRCWPIMKVSNVYSENCCHR